MNTSPWNKDRIIGQKRPLRISHICGFRIRLELEGKTRDLALFQAEQRCCNRIQVALCQNLGFSGGHHSR